MLNLVTFRIKQPLEVYFGKIAELSENLLISTSNFLDNERKQGQEISHNHLLPDEETEKKPMLRNEFLTELRNKSKITRSEKNEIKMDTNKRSRDEAGLSQAKEEEINSNKRVLFYYLLIADL